MIFWSGAYVGHIAGFTSSLRFPRNVSLVTFVSNGSVWSMNTQSNLLTLVCPD